MDKQTQDRLWASMPKEARELVRKGYKVNVNEYDRLSKSAVYNEASACYTKFKLLEDLFGKHNLTSDTEPENEMLTVKRKDIIIKAKECQNKYKNTLSLEDMEERGYWHGRGGLLSELFGDKCLPDKECPKNDTESVQNLGHSEQPSVQVEPKFEVGDKVKIIQGCNQGEVSEIISVDKSDDETPYLLDLTDEEGGRMWYAESDLEPYTEPETKEPDNRQALYDALCELESASVKVRKALISLG